MWGTTSFCDEFTGDFGGAFEATYSRNTGLGRNLVIDCARQKGPYLRTVVNINTKDTNSHVKSSRRRLPSYQALKARRAASHQAEIY